MKNAHNRIVTLKTVFSKTVQVFIKTDNFGPNSHLENQNLQFLEKLTVFNKTDTFGQNSHLENQNIQFYQN